MAAGSFKIYGLQKDGSRIPAAGGVSGGGGQEFINMTANEFEALSITEKQQLYSNGIRVVAVDGELDANNMSDMQRFAAFVHPVGEIVELTVATNPAALWGFGTWESFMPGRVLVGAGTADSGTVYTAGATGGEEKHTLIEAEIPKLSGSMAMHGAENTSKGSNWWNPTGVFGNSELHNVYVSPSNGTTGATSVSYVSFNAGGDQPHNIMQPYGVVYRWLRVA